MHKNMDRERYLIFMAGNTDWERLKLYTYICYRREMVFLHKTNIFVTGVDHTSNIFKTAGKGLMSTLYSHIFAVSPLLASYNFSKCGISYHWVQKDYFSRLQTTLVLLISNGTTHI